MKKIEYDIKTDDEGNSYVELKENRMGLDDMFFCFSIVRYRLHQLLNDEKNSFLPKEAIEELATAGFVVDGLTKKMCELMVGSDEVMDDIAKILKPEDDKEDDN